MRIQLGGYFDRNFGDDVMQLITVNNMPEHDFYVCCPQREFLTHFSGCKNVHLCDSIPQTEAYVNVIGTGFKYESKLSIISKLVYMTHEDSLRGKKTAVIDCSVDKSKNVIQRMLVKRELNKYRLISCRDEVSEEIVSDMTEKSIVRRHEDIVLAANNEYIYKNTGEDCLGIIPVQRGYSENNFDYYSALAKACDRYADMHGKKVLIFALDTGNENDILAAMSVRRLMKHSEMTEIIAYDSVPEYIFKNIARCGRIISSRFHGLIAAMLSGVPVAAVSDTSKIDILSERFGFGKIAKQDLKAQELTELIEGVNASVYLSESIKSDARGHLNELKNYIEN